MLVILFGIVMLVIVVLLRKALAPMATTGKPPIVAGMITAPLAPVYPVMVIVPPLDEVVKPVTLTVTCTGVAEANTPS